MSSLSDFASVHASGRNIVMVTAYDAWTARLLNDSPVDAILVGDSLMMVAYGERDTLGATTEIMARHTRAVANGAPNKFIVADMPFLAARKGKAHALDCAAELLRAGAHAVKLEGLRGHAEVIAHLVETGIPVMGHLGLTPQSVHAFGGFKVQAREAADAARLREDAAALEASGAFSVVLECIPQKLAAEVTASISIPTIGIGAGAGCSGQVLVTHDLLGCQPDFKPRFVRRFGDVGEVLKTGVAKFAKAVRDGSFPTNKESF